MNEITDLIFSNLRWLEDNIKSDDIIGKSKVLDKLALLSLNFSEEVSDAYAVMNQLEDEYKIAVAKFMGDYDGSAAKGEKEAEVTYADMKRDWTTAKNVYRKLNTFLDRVDKVLDAGRQSISVIKQTNLKHMTG